MCIEQYIKQVKMSKLSNMFSVLVNIINNANIHYVEHTVQICQFFLWSAHHTFNDKNNI